MLTIQSINRIATDERIRGGRQGKVFVGINRGHAYVASLPLDISPQIN